MPGHMLGGGTEGMADLEACSLPSGRSQSGRVGVHTDTICNFVLRASEEGHNLHDGLGRGGKMSFPGKCFGENSFVQMSLEDKWSLTGV